MLFTIHKYYGGFSRFYGLIFRFLLDFAKAFEINLHIFFNGLQISYLIEDKEVWLMEYVLRGPI